MAHLPQLLCLPFTGLPQNTAMSYPEGRVSWQPESYAAMGAAVPFTSPDLAGARARRVGGVLSLSLPNPAGMRGVYILDPQELGKYCPATLHDRRLATLLAGLPALTPGTVRGAARRVALEGYAGRPAAAAAARAQAEERRTELTLQLAIMRLVVRQAAGAGGEAAAGELAAKAAIEALAARTGHSVSEIGTAIGALARLAAPIGLPGSDAARSPALPSPAASSPAPGFPALHYPALIAGIEALSGLDAMGGAEMGHATQAAALVSMVARDVSALAVPALARARRLFDRVAATLGAWLTDPGAVTAPFVHLDWLLDGWGPLCLVLQRTPPGRLCAAVTEMGLMVPFIPAEAYAWFGVPGREVERQAVRAEVMGGATSWRKGGAALDLTLRNERLRADAA